MNFLERINKVCINLDNKYNINSGGCCFVAYCIAKELEERNILYNLVVYNYYDQDFNITEGNHYAIKVGNYVINQDDCEDFHREYKVDSDELYMLYYNNPWNKMYSKRWNLIVQTILHSKFRKYDNTRK